MAYPPENALAPAARAAHFRVPDSQRARTYRDATSIIDASRPGAEIQPAIFKRRGQSNSRRALSRMPSDTHGARSRKTSCRALPYALGLV